MEKVIFTTSANLLKRKKKNKKKQQQLISAIRLLTRQKKRPIKDNLVGFFYKKWHFSPLRKAMSLSIDERG